MSDDSPKDMTPTKASVTHWPGLIVSPFPSSPCCPSPLTGAIGTLEQVAGAADEADAEELELEELVEVEEADVVLELAGRVGANTISFAPSPHPWLPRPWPWPWPFPPLLPFPLPWPLPFPFPFP